MEDIGKLTLRLTTAGLILFHGINKIIHGVGFMSAGLAQYHLPGFVAYGVFLGEVVAPLFLIFGLWSRFAALVVIINMVMAILLEAYRNVGAIRPSGAWGLEVEAFYLLTAVVILLIGGGRYALVPEKRVPA